MQLYNQNTAIGWLIIIGAVCLTIAIGAIVDKVKRHHRQAGMRFAPKAIRVESQSYIKRDQRNFR